MKGIYLTGGYPDRKESMARLHDVVAAGFDFVEVGLPFSDPVADGPVIASVINRVRDAGVTTEDIISDIRNISTTGVHLFVMTYANVAYRYGLKAFTTDLEGHVSGLILADVPNRMHQTLRQWGLGLPLIPFVTPESRESDVVVLSNSDAPFVYFIGVRGITGSVAQLDNPEIRERIDWIRRITGKPVVLGFGIRSRDHARTALSVADGYVIGTAAVERQHDGEAYREFLRDVIQA